MAQPNSPHGFAPTITNQSNDWNAACHMYEIPSTDGSAYYIGDVVKPVAAADTGNIWGTMGIAQVAKTTTPATDVAVGIIVSVFRNPFALDTVFVPATKGSTNYYVLVMDDPYATFEAQCDNVGALAATVIGRNISYTIAAPSGISPVSATVLASASSNTTSTLPFRVLGMAQRINATTQASFTPLAVTWNQHTFKSVGVTSA
jgi:hypothetical protein